ncbi:MAG: DUF367 family protein [Thermoplasmata archaeon]
MIKIFIIHMNDDDPKKCTAKKMERFSLAKILEPKSRPRGIILTPYSDIILSKEDLPYALIHGLYAVDISWKHAKEYFENVNGRKRRLPFLVPGNPVNFGHPGQLSTAEAISAALYIMGEKDMALKIMEKFGWGHTFIEMNMELLEEYSRLDRKGIEALDESMQHF